jgi:transposase
MATRLCLADHLSDEDLFACYRAAERPIERTHYQVLWMVCSGFRTEDISVAVGYSPVWIRKLVGRYNEGGARAMGDQRRHNAGGEALLSAEDEQDLRNALAQGTEQGDAWSGAQVARWIRRMSSTWPCSSTALHRYLCSPPMRTKTSLRCQLRPGRRSRRRNSAANGSPKRPTQRRTLS